MPGQVEQLNVTPVIEDEGWAGYQHFTDATRLPFNVLTYPSHNCSMPSSDKIVPDLGKKILGQEWTENQGIIGNKEKFTTASGIELEVRVWHSDTSLEVNNIVGSFENGETITGGTSGATATVETINDTEDLFIKDLVIFNIVGSFENGETITGGTSGATAHLILDNTLRNDIIQVLYTDLNPDGDFYNIPYWYPISEIINPLAIGMHRYSFAQWFDTNLDPSKSPNVPRLVWVNGNPKIYSWIGAIASIVNVNNNGANYLSVDFGTIKYKSLVGTFDTFAQEQITGGASGATAHVSPSSVTGELKVIRITGTFIPGETITGGASGATATVINYIAPLITWTSLGFIDPSIIGETDHIIINSVQYEGLSGWDTPDLEYGPTNPTVNVGDLAFSPIRQDDPVNPTLKLDGLDFCCQTKNYMYYGNWKSRQLFQSNALGRSVEQEITSSNALLDNMTISGTYSGTGTHVIKILITATGTPDKYQWQIDGGTPGAVNQNVSTSPVLITDGISITFGSTTGHTVGDYWEITVSEAISGAWYNFFYSLPIRRPGEGYIFRLPSNFWTMDIQEDKLYINTQFGEWSIIDTELSSDLQSETVSLSPLKQSGALKVIDPWMTGHLEDDLVFVTLDKSLMNIGRQAFLQDPQDKYLSDPVKYDFLPCSFIGGSIKYLGKRLYITSPEQGIMHCLDMAKNYWQPPKTFPEMGILSIVSNDLIAHSNVRNQTFTMFKNVSDDGQSYEVLMRTPPNSYFKLVGRKRISARWDSKFASLSFIEGYIIGLPQIFFTAFLGVNDDVGVSHEVKPVIANPPTDRASIGNGSIASHPLGNDIALEGSYFNEIHRKFKPILSFYFISLQIACISKNHSYSILSMGVNMSFSPSANNTLIGDRSLDNL